MRLFSSLNTGRESLLTHGFALQGSSNDIANVSTPGFKDQRLEFADLLAASQGNLFGSTFDPGSGVQGQELKVQHVQGSLEFTQSELDAAIEGKGFFMIQQGENVTYTRAGNFGVDENGFLVTADGFNVLGFTEDSPDVAVPINIANVNAEAEATTEASLTGNIDAEAEVTVPPVNPQEFDDISAVSTFSTSIEVIDSLGAEHNVVLQFFKTAPLNFTVQAFVDSAEVGGEEGVPLQVGQAELTFNPNGRQPEEINSVLNIAANWNNGADPSAVALDLNGFNSFASGSFVSLANRNGVEAGSVLSNQILDDGTIVAVLNSGDSAAVGRLALATFRSEEGLKKAGDNRFIQTGESGEPSIGAAGEEGRGSVQGGALELSTVDLSREFIDVIRFQRAYQAGSSVIQTTNTLLDTTLQLA